LMERIKSGDGHDAHDLLPTQPLEVRTDVWWRQMNRSTKSMANRKICGRLASGFIHWQR
jgi:hypothetical protein